MVLFGRAQLHCKRKYVASIFRAKCSVILSRGRLVELGDLKALYYWVLECSVSYMLYVLWR